MNWSSILFDWNQIRAFLAVADEGSLSSAARVLGQTQPTIGRQISALEESLNILLFERNGQRLELTSQGADLVVHVRAMADAAHRVSLAAAGQNQEIEGTVRISASDILAHHVLPEFWMRIQEIAPQLKIDLVATNSLSNLLQREADIAIRHVRPEQNELVAKLIRDEKAFIYGARTYLNRRGWPKSLADLKAHDFVHFGSVEEALGHFNPLGYELTEKNFRIGSDSGIASWGMVVQGLGLGVMSDTVAAQSPGLEKVFPDQEALKFPMWLVTHRELNTSRKIRLVFDTLAEFLTEKFVSEAA